MQPVTSQPLTWEQLLEVAPPYTRAVAHPLEFLGGWQLAQATATLFDTGQTPWLLIEGQAQPLEYVQLIAELATAGRTHLRLAIPTSLANQISVAGGERWLWMWREEPLRSLPQGCEIVPAGVLDQELTRFLQLSSPGASTLPGHPEIEFWVVHRAADGSIDACAAGKKWRSGEAVIVSVAVAADARRQGLGTAVTQVATSEWFSKGASRVGLGVNGGNLGAQALYRKLGFTTEIDFTSFELAAK